MQKPNRILLGGSAETSSRILQHVVRKKWPKSLLLTFEYETSTS